MNNIELNETDLQTEIFVDMEALSIEEITVALREAPIRVTHLPTGISAVGEGQGNQVKNKERAMELLRTLLTREDDPSRE